MKKILVAVPTYNCESQIGRVINQFASAPQEIFSELKSIASIIHLKKLLAFDDE